MKWALLLLVVNIRFILIGSELPSIVCINHVLSLQYSSVKVICRRSYSSRQFVSVKAICWFSSARLWEIVQTVFMFATHSLDPLTKRWKSDINLFVWLKKYLTQRIWSMQACNITLALPSWWTLNWLYSCSSDETLLQWQNLSKYEDIFS